VIPARELVGAALEEEGDSVSSLAAPDLDEPTRLDHGGQELVVLPEAQIIELGSTRERHAFEIDDAADSRAGREVTRVDREPVGDIEQRVGVAGKLLPLD
jgi:hypothetical protein